MIFRHTRPRRPTEQRPSEEVLNDLLMVLRKVIDSEKILVEFENTSEKNDSKFQKIRGLIQRVCNLSRMLEARSEDLSTPLQELSNHTSLDMKQLLSDCLEFPKVIPYVRDLNGLRRTFLCFCSKREAIDSAGLGLCQECLSTALDCVKEKKKLPGFILYRSHSPEVRCRHADFNTYLVTVYKEGRWLPAWCEMCLVQEKIRSRNLVSKSSDNQDD